MTNKFTIGITGAGGHIGSELVNYLRGKEFQVVPLKFDLKRNIPVGLLSGIDVLIHCAFVKQEDNANAEMHNYNGSKVLFEECRTQGVKKIIFFSSVTAKQNAASGYARGKFAIEQLLDPQRDFVIRCGMVIGTGGLFQRMLHYAVTHTFIPLIGSGKQVIQLIAVDDVVRCVEQIIVRNLSGMGVLANEEELTYRQFFSTIARVYRKRIWFVPVPAGALQLLLKICKLMHIRTGASAENIQGIRSLRKQRPVALLPTFRTFSEKLVELEHLGRRRYD